MAQQLRIWCCHYCGTDSGTFACCRCSQKKKKKEKRKRKKGDLEGIMLSELSQRQILYFYLHVESKKTNEQMKQNQNRLIGIAK